MVLGIDAGNSRKAYPVALLRKQGVLNDQVGSVPVLLIHSAGDTTTVFSRLVGRRTLTFHAAKPGVVDSETGSTWTPYGECIAGKLKGEKLETITPSPTFWFSWAEFYPDTQVFTAAAR